MGKTSGLITGRSLFSEDPRHIEKGRKVGMMCGWPNQSNTADWRMHIPSRVFAHCSVSKDCSVIRARGSLPSFGGEKNDLRYLRHSVSQLVRPQAPAGPYHRTVLGHAA